MPRLNKYDPLNIPVTREEINTARDELEVAPVLVEGLLIDIDAKAEKRMEDAVTLWDGFGVHSIEWTLADNTVISLTKIELTSLLTQAKIQRALRAMQLHIEARAFKDSPTTTRRDLETWRTAIQTSYA